MKPASLSEAILEPWPNSWSWWLLVPTIILLFPLIKWKNAKFHPFAALPLAWLIWQFIAATQSVDTHLTTLTLRHFTACVVLFYLGYFGLQRSRRPTLLVAGLALAFCWVIRAGFEQHFGGLEATRKYIHDIYGAQWPIVAARNPDFAKRIDNPDLRIFATFVSPNALAGCILMLLPPTLVLLWQLTPKVSPILRRAFVAVLGACAMGILFWSRSKAGWLLALVMLIIAGLFWLKDRLPVRWLIGLVATFLVIGLVGFGLRFSHYFQRGATSVSARFDYWKAACQTIATHPLFGTGPGTFSRPYAKLKAPESEMARLCHNDYLEQGSDSGLVGLLIYCWFILGAFLNLYRYRSSEIRKKSPIIDAFLLGLLGLSLHGFVEYHLYIPALAWPYFFLLGWVLSIDSKP
jgi:O-antigen ligase